VPFYGERGIRGFSRSRPVRFLTPPPPRSRRLHAPHLRSRLAPWRLNRSAPFQIPQYSAYTNFL
jgi:hypothetical protein